MTQLYKNVPVLDSGARGSTTTFVERGIGDVLLAWENEAFLAREGARARQVRDRRAVAISILAEPPVALVDKVVDKRGTRKVAQAYLEYLYTPEGQEIAARNYYRPTHRDGREQSTTSSSPRSRCSRSRTTFGGWQKAQKTHFADGGTFDQIYKPGARQ